MEEYLQFEKKMMNNPKTFFPIFEAGFEGRKNLIWKEFLEWQKQGGKIEMLKFGDIVQDRDNIIWWKIGDEGFAQTIDKLAPFSIEQYKNGISAVFSFMKDRPQYFKFRKLDGMFNPLQLLLYHFL